MSIALSKISYSQIALYCLYFLLMLIGVGIFLIFYKLISTLKSMRRMSNIIRIIKMSFNWLEKIIWFSIILLFFLVLIKFFIRNETFAYTTIVLLIFVLSSQIATVIKET